MIAQAAIRWLLAVFFLVAGIAHFTTLRKYYVAIVPKSLPYPGAIVQITGVFEILGGIGLVVPFTTRFAGAGLICLLIAVFPANVVAARLRYPLHNPLWMRAVAQIVLIGAIAWAAIIS